MADKKGGYWFSLENGTHIYVDNGETPREAVESFLKDKGVDGTTKKAKGTLNKGKPNEVRGVDVGEETRDYDTPTGKQKQRKVGYDTPWGRKEDWYNEKDISYDDNDDFDNDYDAEFDEMDNQKKNETKRNRKPENPNFDEAKFGKYFDENYQLKPEMEDEYFDAVKQNETKTNQKKQPTPKADKKLEKYLNEDSLSWEGQSYMISKVQNDPALREKVMDEYKKNYLYGGELDEEDLADVGNLLTANDVGNNYEYLDSVVRDHVIDAISNVLTGKTQSDRYSERRNKNNINKWRERAKKIKPEWANLDDKTVQKMIEVFGFKN